MKSRKGRNEIMAIKDSMGNWTANNAKIKDEFTSFFDQLFNPTNAEIDRANYSECLGELPTFSRTQIAHLEEPFSSKEIKLALFSVKPLRSPGPDGIPLVFYQKKWDIVGEEVCQATKNFLGGGHMLKETNKTFIALIPKSDQAKTRKSIQTH